MCNGNCYLVRVFFLFLHFMLPSFSVSHTYCLVSGPLFLPFLLPICWFPSISSSVCPHFVCHSYFFSHSFTGSQRYRVVREPIFINVFLFYTQTQVTRFLFPFFFSVFPFHSGCPSHLFTWIFPSSNFWNCPLPFPKWSNLSLSLILCCFWHCQ